MRISSSTKKCFHNRTTKIKIIRILPKSLTIQNNPLTYGSKLLNKNNEHDPAKAYQNGVTYYQIKYRIFVGE